MSDPVKVTVEFTTTIERLIPFLGALKDAAINEKVDAAKPKVAPTPEALTLMKRKLDISQQISDKIKHDYGEDSKPKQPDIVADAQAKYGSTPDKYGQEPIQVQRTRALSHLRKEIRDSQPTEAAMLSVGAPIDKRSTAYRSIKRRWRCAVDGELTMTMREAVEHSKRSKEHTLEPLTS